MKQERQAIMLISVIISTYNRSHILRRTLTSFARQTVSTDRFEVIVVDDGSRDDTGQMCRKMQRTLTNLKYVVLRENAGAARARNRGIEAAAGEYILFTDDDCIPDPCRIEVMKDCLEGQSVVAGAIASPLRRYLPLSHNISQVHRFMPGHRAGRIRFVSTANLGVRRDVLRKVGTFRADLRIAQDTEWSFRLQDEGFSIYFAPEAIVSHIPDETTLRAAFSHSTEHAAVTIHLRNRYREILHTPFILRSPAAILLCAPFIALKVTAGIYLCNPKLSRAFWTAPLVYCLKLA